MKHIKPSLRMETNYITETDDNLVSITRQINGETHTITLSASEIREINDRADYYNRLADVLTHIEENNFTLNDEQILAVLTRYLDKYGEADYGSWRDCLESAVSYVLHEF